MVSVLQVTPALDAGGVERTTIEIAEAIVRDGGAAFVASRGGRLEGELAAAGGELIRIPADSKNPLDLFANARRIEDIARARHVDLIHARSRAPAWSALWAARKLKLPFVTTYHGVYNGRSWPKRLYNSVMARGDLVIANSEYTRAHVLKTHPIDPGRVVAIPRGVDLEAFDPDKVDPPRAAAMRAAWGAGDAFVALLPARLTRWKGQLVAIEAAAALKRMGVGPFKLVLAGDAQGRDAFVHSLRGAIADAGLGDCVVIAGHIGDMPAALMAADVVLTPSIEPEAFGRSAVEAGAMGKPVIASRLGGYAETIVEGETGFLTPPGDAAALAGALARSIALGTSGRTALGRNGQTRVRDRYSKAALQASTLQVYRRLVGDRR